MENMKEDNKVGLAFITCKRYDYLIQSLTEAKKHNYGGASKIVVIEDGTDYTTEQKGKLAYLLPKDAKYFSKDNGGVATAKNAAIQTLMEEGCEHLFIMEDDILMTNKNVCQHYINYAKDVGVQHLNFAHHGPANVDRKTIYEGVNCHPNSVGAWSYYTREVIDKVGYIDINFVNAWEHVEHTYRIGLAGLTTPFWYFADHPLSARMLTEIEGSIDNSSIRPRDDWKENIAKGKEYWIEKHGSWLPERPRY